ncbi:hypothetical protein N9I94_03250, partial [Candidatus Pelagibacter sp.]|nr:hypothetical protein [Candidatus Pelagibacter sp.]
ILTLDTKNNEIPTFSLMKQKLKQSFKRDILIWKKLLQLSIKKNITKFNFKVNVKKNIYLKMIKQRYISTLLKLSPLQISNGINEVNLKINYSIDESAYLLGYSKFKTFKNIHLPYLKNSVLLIGILLTIEIIKELPITLIMRPFNFETFATKAYIYASQDLLEAAAAPSLLLILIASCFILITSRYILKD